MFSYGNVVKGYTKRKENNDPNSKGRSCDRVKGFQLKRFQPAKLKDYQENIDGSKLWLLTMILIEKLQKLPSRRMPLVDFKAMYVFH